MVTFLVAPHLITMLNFDLVKEDHENELDLVIDKLDYWHHQ
jgi:hypothetical protein